MYNCIETSEDNMRRLLENHVGNSMPYDFLDEPLYKLGIDSLGLIELSWEIPSILGIHIEDFSKKCKDHKQGLYTNLGNYVTPRMILDYCKKLNSKEIN